MGEVKVKGPAEQLTYGKSDEIWLHGSKATPSLFFLNSGTGAKYFFILSSLQLPPVI